MRKVLPLIILASATTMSAPVTAAANGGANCAGLIASNSGGMPAFVSDLIAGFGQMFGFLISHDCDIPET